LRTVIAFIQMNKVHNKISKTKKRCTMYLKDHIIRVENVKALQALDAANIDHKVIAMFMTCEGLPLQTYEVSAILNSYGSLGIRKVPAKKVQALISAKQLGEEDESLPCPASY
jgi:hypothetical protein